MISTTPRFSGPGRYPASPGITAPRQADSLRVASPANTLAVTFEGRRAERREKPGIIATLGPQTDTKEKMRALIDAWWPAIESGAVETQKLPSDAETRSRLASLGYLGGGSAPPARKMDRHGPNPVRRVDLFQRFERGVPRRQVGGFGLGLWITRQVVEAMGGQIVVDSALGRGSTFSVALPRRQAGAGK